MRNDDEHVFHKRDAYMNFEHTHTSLTIFSDHKIRYPCLEIMVMLVGFMDLFLFVTKSYFTKAISRPMYLDTYSESNHNDKKVFTSRI